jgi:hypothetical protein
MQDVEELQSLRTNPGIDIKNASTTNSVVHLSFLFSSPFLFFVSFTEILLNYKPQVGLSPLRTLYCTYIQV